MASSDPAQTLVDVSSGKPVAVEFFEPESTPDNNQACRNALERHKRAKPSGRFSCELGTERFRKHS